MSVVATGKRGGLYLTFVLQNEQYGLEILKVNAILGLMPITPLPHAPHYVKGVINLRGKIIPVIDMRLRFDMPEAEYTQATCIIVIDVGTTLIGVIVDTVKDVINVADDQIEDPPRYGSAMDSEHIRGLGKIGRDVKILLDIDKLVSDLDVGGLMPIR